MATETELKTAIVASAAQPAFASMNLSLSVRRALVAQRDRSSLRPKAPADFEKGQAGGWPILK
jgi:hypothetical protein